MLALAVAPALSGGTQAQGEPPSTGSAAFRVAVVGPDILVEGGGRLHVVELPEDGLLYGPGGDMNWPQPNPGAPSTARGVLLGSSVEPGPGCQAVPQVKGVEGFTALCPLQPGTRVRVGLGAGDDRLHVDGGNHGRYYNSVYEWLSVPLEVRTGAGEDNLELQTLGPVNVDAGPGDDRIWLGLSGPGNALRGGPGDDTFAYEVTVYDHAYDGTPPPRTRRVELDCGRGADFVDPHPRFHHGRGCPAQPPSLVAKPLTLRGRCRARCRWRGAGRIVVKIANPTSRAVTLRSVRLAIERWDSEPYEPLFVKLARRQRIRLPARGSARIVMPARRRRALDRQLDEYILSFGVVPELRFTGEIVEPDGDRTTVAVPVPISEKHIVGIPPLD